MHYKRDGKPYTGTADEITIKWAKDFEDMDKRVVKQETLKNGVRVSTVWLGLDHGFKNKKPLIFETMVFNADEEEQERYATEEEAVAGHKRYVAQYQNWEKI